MQSTVLATNILIYSPKVQGNKDFIFMKEISKFFSKDTLIYQKWQYNIYTNIYDMKL